MRIFLGVLMVLFLNPVASSLQTRRVYWQNDVNVPQENDETVDILPSSVFAPPKNKTITSPGFINFPSLPGDAKAKLPPFLRVIEDEFGDQGVINAINWSNKLKPEVIDLLRHKNRESDQVELVDTHRHRRDVTDAEEEEEEKKKTLEWSVDRKVLNNGTRPKDQGQMIRIELPVGDHSGNKTKLLRTNDTGFVNLAGGKLVRDKAGKNTKQGVSQYARVYQDEQEEMDAVYKGDSSSPRSRERREAEEIFGKERSELEKITLQFKHLSESRKNKFCLFLKRDSLKDPLEMLMALLGTVYSESGEESGAHWDRVRGMRLNETQDTKARQKLILTWACEDRRQGQDRLLGDALRSMGISPASTDNGKFDSWSNQEFPFAEPRDPRLIVKPAPSRRRIFKENPSSGDLTSYRQLDDSPFSLKLRRGNHVAKQEHVIIDTDEDSSDYRN